MIDTGYDKLDDKGRAADTRRQLEAIDYCYHNDPEALLYVVHEARETDQGMSLMIGCLNNLCAAMQLDDDKIADIRQRIAELRRIEDGE